MIGTLTALIASGNVPFLIFGQTGPLPQGPQLLPRLAYSLLIRVVTFVALLLSGFFSALLLAAWNNKSVIGIAYVLFRNFWLFLSMFWLLLTTCSSLLWRLVVCLWRLESQGVDTAFRYCLDTASPLLWSCGWDAKDRYLIAPSRFRRFVSPLSRFAWNLLAPLTSRYFIAARARGWIIPNPLVPVLRDTCVIEGIDVDVANPDDVLNRYIFESTLSPDDLPRVPVWQDDSAYPIEAHPYLWAILLCRVFSLLRISTYQLLILPFFLFGFVWFLIIYLLLRLAKFTLLLKLEIITYVFSCFIVCCTMPDVVLDATLHFSWKWSYGFWFSNLKMFPFSRQGWRLLFQFSKVGGLAVSATILNQIVAYTAWWHGRLSGGRASQAFQTKSRLNARFNSSWAALQKTVASMNLPSFVRRAPLPLSIDGLQQTFKELKDLGWPVNVSVSNWQKGEYDTLFPDWQFGSLDFEQGIRQMTMYTDAQLQEMADTAQITYKRTEQYQSFMAELKSTSRYFNIVDYNFPDLLVEDMWELVGTIFASSRLTPFDLVISNWEKAYGLGVFAKVVDPRTKHERKMSRREFINSIGLKSFRQLWARTFSLAPTMVPIAPVSIKREALPPKKWLFNKVRTIIGAPITHAISSYMFNYGPNHNFGWHDTPIKIGMPLTGWGLGQVFRRHAFKDIHYAGDCSEFDSTLSGKVLDIIAGIRKRGYKDHRDFDDIADLIDREYASLPNQLLGLTSRGAIYKKGTGLSTGHTSTSMDNSLAMTMLYLMAWKQLTGLSAVEFKLYCELSVYGDDHLISWRLDAPMAWTFPNIQKVMATWGITNNLEATGDLSTLEFLSKFGSRPSPAHISELNAAGLEVPDWIVYHNRDKLIGKLTAPVKSRDLAYQAKRLKGYLPLCAHHHDLYDQIVAAIHQKAVVIAKKDPTYQLELPTYDDVLKSWYTNSKVAPGFFDPDLDKTELADEDAVIASYGEVTIVDAAVNFLANLVDILNPDVYNSGMTNFLQRPLRRYLEWPLRFTKMANFAHSERHVAQLVQKSAYDWITNDLEVPLATPTRFATSYLIKHWAFLLLTSGNSFGVFSGLLWIDKKLADLKYLAFGHIDLSIRRIDIPLWKISVCGILGALPDIPLPDYRETPGLSHLSMISIGAMVDMGFGIATNLFFGKVVPPSFAAVYGNVTQMTEGTPILVKAGTGTGKTTAMAQLLCTIPRWRRVIYVVPRSAIVTGVVPYMSGRFDGLIVSGATTGMILNREAKLIYMTPAEVLLNPAFLRSDDTLWVFDECHVDEPLHRLAEQVLLRQPWLILTSATPTQAQLDAHITVEVKAANVWQKEYVSVSRLLDEPNYATIKMLADAAESYPTSRAAYFAFVIRYLQFANPYARSLVFVNTKAEAIQLAERVNTSPGPSGHFRSACVIDSDNKMVDTDSNVIVATSVADVGVTIPDVDHVFTTNTCIGIRLDPETGKSKPVYYTAPDSLITQRAGRTGRTNNGRVLIWNIRGLPAFEPLTDFEVLSNLLASGFTLHQIGGEWPELVRSVFNDPQLDEERLLASWENMKNVRLDEAVRWYTEHPHSIPPPMKVTLDVTAEVGLGTYEASNTLEPMMNTHSPSSGVNWSVANEFSAALSALVKWVRSGVYYDTTHWHHESSAPEDRGEFDEQVNERLSSAIIGMFSEEALEEAEMDIVDQADNLLDEYRQMKDDLERLRLDLVQAQAAKAALGEYDPLKPRGWDHHFKQAADFWDFMSWVQDTEPEIWRVLVTRYFDTDGWDLHQLLQGENKDLARDLYNEWHAFSHT